MATSQEAVTLEVIPGVDLQWEGELEGGAPIMVRLAPPPGSARTPSDICCIVDVSGSMGNEAMLKTESGENTGHGLSVLDIVKHSLKTIIMNLTDADRLAVVAYSNNAETKVGLTAMDASGRAASQLGVDSLQPSGMTNLWDGLKTGVELLKAGSAPGRLQHIMLFTDGLPNINPPRGILPMLKKLKEKEPGGRLPCTINTFGFGNELESELLNQIAIDGGGAYAFIPDAGFVGTVFVNSMSNLLVTMGKDATLTLLPTNGASFTRPEPLGGHPSKQEGGAMVVSLGSLQYGQSKDVVVKMNIPAAAVSGGFLQATLDYGTSAGAAPAVSTCGTSKGDPASTMEVEKQRLRLQFVDAVRQCMQMCKLTAVQKAQRKEIPLGEASDIIAALAAEIRSSAAGGSEEMQALLEDAQGQVTEALSKEEWYTKWGVHYLPSLMFAHLTQQCNNFKDAGVQSYGGSLFESIRDKADDIFLGLPAPKPTAPPPAPTPAAVAPAPRPAAAPAVSMSAFYDRYAGCVDGACSVDLADGGVQRLDDVRRGDVLRTVDGGRATVRCVVRTRVAEGRLPLVELPGGLRLTPHHPVHLDGAWRFPAEAAPVLELPTQAVFTLLLEEPASAVVAQGVPFVVLGHGIEEGAARHAFFGSRAAVERDLAKFPGFEDGLVDLAPGDVARDPATGLVSGLHPAAAQGCLVGLVNVDPEECRGRSRPPACRRPPPSSSLRW